MTDFSAHGYTDVMVDIETLDTTPTSVVLSIAAVAFGKRTYQQGPRIVLDVQDQIDRGRTISASTLLFWLSQPPEAQKHFKKGLEPCGDELKNPIALARLASDLAQFDRIWANGPSFDMVIIEDLFRTYHVTPPELLFRKFRDQRTVQELIPDDQWPDLPVGFIAHDPMWDCINQIGVIQTYWSLFNAFPPEVKS
jgi:hypothetical protein